MLLVLLAHVLAALVAPTLVGNLGRRAFWILALAPATAVVYALSQVRNVLAGHFPTEHLSWVPTLGFTVDLRLDPLSWLMLLVVGSVGTLVLLYCSSYFARDARGLGRFGAFLVAFAGSMAGLVVTDNMLVLVMFWELTAVFSYLLIGHYTERKASRRAAMQAMVVTTAGGLALLVGAVALGVTAGTWSISALIAAPPSGPVVTAAVLCLLVGAASKSALVPTHFWLPAAMAAPTPVSAYLHAAAMVKAGIYLLARFAPAFSDLTAWRVVVLVLGGATLLLGGYRALRQHDLKLILAFGTVSQLGLLTLLLGYGTRATALAGLALLGAHAMFKASLFLVVGAVDAATGTRDIRRLAGLWRRLPGAAIAAVLATASMIGLPPFAGYVAKETALAAWEHEGGTLPTIMIIVVAVGSALTVGYGLRFCWGAFKPARASVPAAARTTPGATEPDPVVPPGTVHPQPFWMIAPPLVLAVLGLAVALVPSVGERLLAPHADTYPAGDAGHLTLWAGFTPVLAVTAAILLAGGLMFWRRSWVERLQNAFRFPGGADGAYHRLMRQLDRLSADVTAVSQRGSLPFYLGVILIVLAVGPGFALTWGLVNRPVGELPAVARANADDLLQIGPFSVVPWDRPAQLVVVLVVVVAAVLTANARRRLKAVLLVGVAGYGNAALFMLHGAPDLALTQVLCETLTLLVMILVLRRLPPYFSDRPLAMSRWLRLAIGATTGIVVMMFVAAAPLTRVSPPVSVNFPEEAEIFGGGHNIVNVTLVDIRAWDTVGEISVLLVAATGVASLVFLRGQRSEGPDPRHPVTPRAAGSTARASRRRPAYRGKWLTSGPLLAPERRSMLFEILTRIMFHPMLLFALYLMFSGHNAPGGGFAAGLVAGLALTIRYLAGGRYELGEAAPVHPGLVLGTGLFLSAGVGLVALLFGQAALESTILHLTLPVLGETHLVTSLFFDLGVFLVVIGLVIDILRTFGAELDRQAEFSQPVPSRTAVLTGGGSA